MLPSFAIPKHKWQFSGGFPTIIEILFSFCLCLCQLSCQRGWSRFAGTLPDDRWDGWNFLCKKGGNISRSFSKVVLYFLQNTQTTEKKVVYKNYWHFLNKQVQAIHYFWLRQAYIGRKSGISLWNGLKLIRCSMGLWISFVWVQDVPPYHIHHSFSSPLLSHQLLNFIQFGKCKLSYVACLQI